MKCSSIKLAIRTKEELKPFFQKTGRRCHPAILSLDNNSERYSLSETSIDKPGTDQPSLSVLTINLPKDLKAFNTGSSIQRWASKRPRIKSGKASKTKYVDLQDADLDSLNVSNLIKELQNDCCESVKEEEIEDMIDPDIQRLIDETSKKETSDIKRISFDVDEQDDKSVKKNKKRKHKKKKKKVKDEDKKKLIKTVSFSLSKPPTPQTEQIIRVDVISNYSVEFVQDPDYDQIPSNHSNSIICIEENDVNARDTSQDHSDIKNRDKNLIVESKKSVLFERHSEK